MWSRLTASVFVEKNKPIDVVDKVMKAAGTGFASFLNLEVCTTAADSPFQNAVFERIHSITYTMLSKLEKQCPRTPL